MGSGIAQLAAQKGYSVQICESLSEVLERSAKRLQDGLVALAAKGKLEEGAETISSRIKWHRDLEGLEEATVIIEAIPEDLELKRKLFSELEQRAPKAILATNTSTLSVSAIGSRMSDPTRIVGMHFFNPATLMPLVEVIAGDQTAQPVLEETIALCTSLGKTPVLTRDTPGFIVNRVARPFYGEALKILLEHGQEEVLTEVIDRVMRGLGFRMGPFELMDLIGLDVNLAATRSVYEAFFGDAKYRPSPIQQHLVASGRLGRKSGHGFYRYESEAQ